jgi:hypothetical protein
MAQHTNARMAERGCCRPCRLRGSGTAARKDRRLPEGWASMRCLHAENPFCGRFPYRQNLSYPPQAKSVKSPASACCFIDTDDIVPHNDGMGSESSAAIVDGAGLAAQISWCGGILWFGLTKVLVMKMARQSRIGAWGRCAQSFLRTTLFLSNRRFVPDHRSAAGLLPLFAERFACA